jgi:hypothetical protein
MARNPILSAVQRRALNRWRVEGWRVLLAEVVGPIVATVWLTPLLKPVFMSWLALPRDRWADGASAVALRAGLLVLAILSVDVYSALIRTDERRVLGLLPIDPHHATVAGLAQVAGRRWWLVPAAACLLSPIAIAGAWRLWLGAVAVVMGAWAMGLWLSAWVHLRAVDVAENKGSAGYLDMVRGSNPREQAAFVYAPGVVLLVGGIVISWSTNGIVAVDSGSLVDMVWLGLPIVVAGFARSGLTKASVAWFRGGVVLADIDARFYALEDANEARRVYLDWVVRWLPSRLGVYVLHDLRAGWRTRRSWISMSWLFAVAAFGAGWTAGLLGPIRAADVALCAAWTVAAVGVFIDADEPEFLRVWLPRETALRGLARLLVLMAWVQPAAWLGAASVLIRRGTADAGFVLAMGLVSAGAASLLAVLCGRLGRAGLAVYAPGAVVLAAASLAWVGV